MQKIVFSLILFTSVPNFSSALSSKSSRYKIDETSIDVQFAKSQDITSQISEIYLSNEIPLKSTPPSVHSRQETATIVAIVTFITGVGIFVPIHRFVLGTGGKGATIFFAYFCTASGCGVGLMLDTIFLIMNMDDTNYEDCPKVIMWKE